MSSSAAVGRAARVYHLRSFDLDGKMIPVQCLSASSDREAAAVARELVKPPVAGFELWAGRRCVCIEPHRRPVTEVEIKAEWERRTESIRRHHSDLIFRNSPELFTREFRDPASAPGDVETHELDRETDADALTLDWPPPADSPGQEGVEPFRESRRLPAEAKKRSKDAIPRRGRTNARTFRSPLMLRATLPVLGIVLIGSLAAWQYLGLPHDGTGLARIAAVSPSSLLAPPPSEISASSTFSAVQLPDPLAAAANPFSSTPFAVPAPEPSPTLAQPTSSHLLDAPMLSTPGIGVPTPASATESASAGASAPSPESAADATHVFGIPGQTGFRISLRATAETWLEVKDGATSIFRRLMEPGDEYRLPEKSGLIMRVGNAQGIEVLVDSKLLPSAAQPSQHRRTVVNLDPRALLARAEIQ